MNEKVSTILSDIIVAASSRHSHYTRFGSNYIIRPKVRTNFGIQTFAFTTPFYSITEQQLIALLANHPLFSCLVERYAPSSRR